jgi:UDP-N-acetylmuramoyl-tripeptide--D-alanyl-D-alanine ligase
MESRPTRHAHPGSNDGTEAMQAISFHELIAATGGTPVGLGDLDERFGRIETDSRRVQAGDLFWALAGPRHDGHTFVNQAFDNGASAAVVEADKTHNCQFPRVEVEDSLLALWNLADWYRQQFEALVIGVTGSVGKTTTRRMIASVLSTRFSGIESPHNYNNEYGVPLSLFRLEAAHEFAVIELAAGRTGDIAGLAALAHPEVGVVTAVGPAHLDQFGSVENIVRTKGELLDALPETGFAVLNGDDRQVRQMASRTDCPVILVGEREHNDIRAHNVAAENGWLRFQLDRTEFRVPAAGRHHLTAALIAVAIGRQVDMTDEEIAQGLRKFEPAPGRCRPMPVGPWTVIDDTYNANPLSMSAACRTLREWETPGKRILVAGDMLALGEWSRDFHRLFGEEVVRSRIDRLIAVGSRAATVAGSARKYGMDAGCLGACRDHDTALLLLDCWLEPGDIVLVKGSRAMRMEGIVEGLTRLAERHVTPAPYRHVA